MPFIHDDKVALEVYQTVVISAHRPFFISCFKTRSRDFIGCGSKRIEGRLLELLRAVDIARYAFVVEFQMRMHPCRYAFRVKYNNNLIETEE